LISLSFRLVSDQFRRGRRDRDQALFERGSVSPQAPLRPEPRHRLEPPISIRFLRGQARRDRVLRCGKAAPELEGAHGSYVNFIVKSH
jgi:hypothetical protein